MGRRERVVFAAVQVVVMLGAAVLFGLNNQGSLALLLIGRLLLSLGAIGFGLLVALISGNDSDALNLGSTVTMVQVFLSGAFFAFPSPMLFTLAGHEIVLFDVLPATHILTAMQQIILGGASLDQVAFRFAAAALLSIVYFGVSVMLFQRVIQRVR